MALNTRPRSVVDRLNLRPDEQGIERADLNAGRYFFSNASRFCFCPGLKEKNGRSRSAGRGGGGYYLLYPNGRLMGIIS